MGGLRKIYAEITNACNLRCPFCPPSAREAGFLSRDRFEALLGKVRGKAQILYFHLKGEPLLHPDLGDFIRMAGDSGFLVHLTTNGTSLRGKSGELSGRPSLRRLNVSLQSLHAFDDDGARAILGDILAAVAELRSRFRDSGAVISLRLWNDGIGGTRPFVMDALEDAFGLGRGSLVPALRGKRGFLLAPGVTLHPGERFDWPVAGGIEKGNTGFCQGLRDQAGILLDGTVVPCCLDGEGVIALGNIYETDWDGIMESKRARALYDGFSRRMAVEPLCRTCGFRMRFGA